MSLSPLHPEDPASTHDLQTPADLRALEASLLRLARDERAAASRGFEDRLMAASVGSLPGASAAPRMAPTLGHDERSVAGVIYRKLSFRLRMAAAIMLTAGVGVAVLAVWGIKWNGTTSTTGLGGTHVAINTPTADVATTDIDTLLAAVDTVDSLLVMDSQLADSDSTDTSLLNDVLENWPSQDAENGVSQ